MGHYKWSNYVFNSEFFRLISLGEEAYEFLSKALGDILHDVSSGSFSVVSLDEEFRTSNNEQNSSNNDNNSDTGESSCKRLRLDQELFHSQLR